MPADPNLKGHLIASVPHIGFDDIDHRLSWTGLADAMERGHKLAPAIHEDVYLENRNKGFFNRCAMIPGLGLATKSVTVFPQNRQATPPLPSIQGAVLLFDDVTGALMAVLDGELVTKWKTTGDSVLGARLLARHDSSHLVIVGAGTVGGYSIEAYCEVFPSLNRVSVWNRSPQAAQALAERYHTLDVDLQVVSSLENAVRDADIVSCATMSPTPVLKGAWVPEGCHVDLIGAFLPHMREADDDLLLASKVFVDSRRSTFEDIGEIAIPLNAGTITESHILGDYYDLCTSSPYERSRQDITLFKNGGGGHLDLMCAQFIYQTYHQ